MKLNIKAVVIAEAFIGAVLFILCRIAFVVAPNATLATLKYLTHIDWSPLTLPVTMTWAGFVLGLIVFTIFIAIVGAAWAWIYNRFARGALA
jgi:hypothetical protein